MRRWVVFALLLAFSRGVAAAPRPDAPSVESMTPEQAAEAVLSAVKSKQTATLTSLVDLDLPDPWIVVDILCSRAEVDAALAFAKASTRPTLAALATYVASRRGKDPETAIRSAIFDAGGAFDEGRFEAALSKIDGVASKGDSVLACLLASLRGDVLASLDRHEEAAREFAAAGAVAARLGWTARAGLAYVSAGSQAYRRSDWKGALAEWQQALPFLEQGRDRVMLARALQNVALVANSLGDWRRALEIHERALKIREELKEPRELAQSYSNLGLLHQGLGDLGKALEYYQKALALRKEIGDPALLGASLSNVGSVHQSGGALDQALDFYGKALALQRAAGDKVGAAFTLANLGLLRAAVGESLKGLALEDEARAALAGDEEGSRATIAEILSNSAWIHYTRGDYGRALESLAKAEEANAEVEDARLQSKILGIEGAVHLRLADYPKAMGLLLRAQQVAARIGDRAMEGAVLSQIGEVQRKLGEFPKALETQERARSLAEEAGDRASLSTALANIGTIYLALGDHRKAAELYESARALAEKLGRRSDVASCLATLGVIRAREKDFAGAFGLLEKALAIQQDLGDRPGVADTLSREADIKVRAGEPAAALPLLDRSRRMREDMKDRAGIASVEDVIGDARLAMKEPKEALASYLKAAEMAERLREPALLADALTGASEAHLELGDPALALEKARRAASSLDRLARGQGEEEGAAAQSQYARLYDAGTRAAARLGDVGEAAFFLETGRAGTLLESLGGREMLKTWSAPPDLLAAETKARADESAARRAHADALETDDRALIQAKRIQLEATRAALDGAIARITRGGKTAIVVQPTAATLEEMQGFLEPNDALVLYWLLPDEGVALVIAPDSARLIRLGRTSDLEAACAALTLTDPKTDPKKGIDELRKAVAEKLELPESTKRVIVSSDGALSYVPFSLLFPGRLVAYVPSGTAYGQLRGDRKMTGDGVLALGDPDYRAADANAVALVRGGTRLLPLPGTRIEAMAVGDVRLLGAEATAAQLRKTVEGRRRWHAIHLGCHGLVDPERPMRCSLALTPEAGGSGLLLAQDVGLLKMPADLAVLSACETMKGRVYRGEGIVGLTRMFMYAGAPRVLTSLWKVDDEATRALMIEFYARWNPKDGSKPLGTAEALAAAQAEVQKQEKWKHPYFWAAWVLWGLPD